MRGEASIQTCAVECGARCCRNYQHKVQVVFMNETEAMRLKAINPEAPIVPGNGSDKWAMFLGDGCVFLASDNKCSVYEQRPMACQTFPTKPADFCLVWPK